MTETVTAARPTSTGRWVSLDGLRGIASVIVVLHHLSLTFRPFSDTFIVPVAQHPAVGTTTWWFTSTPAQLVIAGPEAVLVFFVLSGLVLTLPTLGGGFSWPEYYPRRLVRLYLPAMASVVLAALWLLAVIWSSAPSTSLWVQAYRLHPTVPQVLGAFDLLFGDTSINNPLWTLRWEVLFSLLLPVFILLARAVGRRWYLGTSLAIVAIVLGQFIGALQFLPVFFLGTLVAVRMDDVTAWVERHPARASWIGAAVLVVSLLLLDAHWTGWAVLGGAPRHQWLFHALEPIGALGLVLVAAFWQPAVALLSTGFFRWLGRTSFSLYLVHVPIIVALDAVFGSALPLLRVGVSFATAVVVAELFRRLVEQPAHQLSKRVGRIAAGILNRGAVHPAG